MPIVQRNVQPVAVCRRAIPDTVRDELQQVRHRLSYKKPARTNEKHREENKKRKKLSKCLQEKLCTRLLQAAQTEGAHSHPHHSLHGLHKDLKYR